MQEVICLVRELGMKPEDNYCFDRNERDTGTSTIARNDMM